MVDLKDRLKKVYLKNKHTFSGDDLFWEIVDICSPRGDYMCRSAIMVIIAKYFESCDIFEEPKKES